MDEIGENMSSEESNRVDTPSVVKKPKKRSLVERELETNLTTWITSPVTTDGLSTSRYGRSRRLKTEYEFNETRKVDLKSPKDITPGKMQSAAYKMHASNSPCKKEVKTESYLDNQVDNIYQENISLSRFSVEATSPSPAKKFPKVYIRKDLIQNREVEEPIMLIKNLFSPTKSSKTPNSIIELSSEKKAKQNGHIDNTSVVKTLDFDGKKKVQIDPKVAPVPKNELFEFEAKCTYQVGDIAWARMGTFPFWPCIVTREPSSDMFVKKKMFGRVEHDIIHVTFLGDNGRRSWIVDNMLQQYQGLQHFEETRDKFTNEDKKKDPKLYAAYFISEKKQPLWNNSVEEADTLMREPKRLRVDIFHDILWKSRTCKRQKSGKITRTDSDVSLSESLYDSLFSEDDKSDDAEKSKSRPRNKSFDVSEVVTACLDNMAAKTGITKIQRQSHMDRWLQKAKSKTPEKISKLQIPQKVERKVCDKSKNKTSPAATQSSYKLRKSNDSQSTLFNSKNNSSEEDTKNGRSNKTRTKKMKTEKNEIVEKVESQTNTTQTNAVIVIDDDSCNSLDKKVSTQESYNSLEENKDVTNVKLNRELNDTDEKRNQDSSINHKIVPEMEATQESAIGQVNDVTDVKLNKYIDKVEKIDQDSLLRDAITKASDDLAPQVKTTEDSVISKANEVSHVINEELISHKFLESDIVENMDQDSLINDATSEISNENIPGVGTQKSDNFVDSNKEPNPDVEVNQNSMEVDEHLDIAANLENLKADSEIVSRESVQAIEVKLSENSYQNEICMKVEKAGMKDKHGATNETSVTEKKNDDTLNLQAVEEKQESSIRPEKSKENKTGNNIFLEITNSDIVNISATQLERNPINKDTNDKSNKTEETDTSYGKITKGEHKVTEQGSEETFIFKDSYNNNGDIDVDSKRRNTKYEAIDDNLPENVEKDILNESGNSESILCFDNDKGKNDFRTSLESDNFISTIENTQTTTYHANEKFEKLAKRTDLDEEKKKEGSERLVRTNAESPTFTQYLDSQITDENNTDTELETNTKSTNFYKVDDDDKLTNVLENRYHVESPTFTQLLESEEFFRDVNEVCDAKEKSLNLSSADIEKLINEPDFTQQSKLQNNVQINSKIYDKTTKPSSGDKMPVNIQNGQTKLKIQINDIHADSKISEDNSNKIYNKSNDKFNQLVSDKVQYKSLNHDKRTVNKTKGQDDETCDDDDDDEESEDEPSPEYESLDEDITEDFRKHLQSIENNIKDQKDEEQIVKICNEIAEKAKLSPTKYVDLTCDTKPLERIKAEKEESSKLVTDLTIKQQEIKKTVENDANRFTENLNEVSESPIHHKDIELSPTNLVPLKDNTRIHEKQKEDIAIIMNGNATEREMIKHTTRKLPSLSLKTKDLSPVKKESKQRNREPKVVISPLKFDTNLKITNKFIMDNKSCRKKLSLKRHSPKSEKTKTNSPERIQTENKIDEIKDLEVEPLVKKEVTEDNTQKLDKESAFDKNITEPVKLNGYHKDIDSKFTNIQDLNDDKDFDIDAISINSEDSVVSLPQDIPRRNLRSRPERTLENALKSPEFLNYLELKQDVLMDEHPELNDKEILSYVYKTWQYEEDLKSDVKKIDDAHHSGLVKGIRQDTPSRKKSKKSQPKHTIENYLRDKYDKCSKTIDFESSENVTISDEIVVKQDTSIVTNEIQKIKDEDDSNKNHGRNKIKGQNNSNNIQNGDITDTTTNTYIIDKKNRKDQTESKDKSVIKDQSDSRGKVDNIVKNDNRTKLNEAISNGNSISPPSIDFTDDDVVLVKDKYKDLETVIIKAEESSRKSLRNRTGTPKTLENSVKTVKEEFDNESMDSDNSEINLRQLRSKVLKEKVNENKNDSHEVQELQDSVKCEADDDTASDNETLLIKKKKDKTTTKSIEDPEFIKYLELRQDAIMDENPQLTGDEIVNYLHKTWLYEESTKSDIKKNDELEQANLVKGLSSNEAQPRKVKRKPKIEKNTEDTVSKEKPRRKVGQPLYNEEFYSDIEEELEVFEIFKHKKTPITVVSKTEEKSPKNTSTDVEIIETKSKDVKELTINDEQAIIDEIELYFTELAKPKPNVFKGLIRERVCDICEREGSLIKCKSCHGMFHTDCVKKQQQEIIEIESLPPRGRKKKRKLGRKPKSLDSENSDDKSQDASMDMSVEELILPPEISTFDADTFEKQLEAKMKKILENAESNYDSYSSDDGIDWDGTVAGKCEIVDVKLKRRTPPIDFSDFRCNNCLKHDTPICYVCRSAISKTEKKMRQKCIVGQCNKYYHLECLDHWPQTQFNSGETSRNNKKNNEYSETLTCPRHVCHTCVSDDPRGCKTRFSADKLAKCVRCPATYHSFNKCLPAGTQVLTASQIICPRHYEQKPGKVSCHVNTGWCFICAEGGSLICCEYCPTSFHAECLNIKPPEGNYMCEDCETGRLPLYGEMVWVKLGHYRWWPGIILHPSEIPENLFLMKHGIGEFVVRFFGQYDHYWVNRGRVFPYQEGDSGRISSQRSKIDAAFTMAIEHAQRAYEILKNADKSNDEESQDIASSLLPPHYVKLKSNKPSGALCGRRMEDPSLSLTACECSPTEPDPCGPYSHCLNRMLLTECGPTCRTGDRCNNRAFEKRLYPKLVPYRTPHRGWGLKTLEDIKAGQFVIEYVGELIDEEEFRRRMRRKHEIRDENYYFLTLDKERMIDAGPKGNLARFMNHCCEPNCETQKWTVLGDVRVGLFAIDDIPANTEVTFNYKLECDGIEKKRCLCGAKRCSGYIGAKLKQDESQSKKGKNGKVKRTYNKKKKAEDSPSTSKSKPRRSLGRPPKPKELTEIEKDLLIINTAANEISGDDNSRRKSEEDKNQMTLKRKRNSMSTEEVSNQEPSVKKVKYDNEKPLEVGD